MTKQEVQKIALLARLELTWEEVEIYVKQLTQILEYVEQLNAVDTKDIPITAQVGGLTNVWREDGLEECGIRDELLGEALEREEGGVKVKSVF